MAIRYNAKDLKRLDAAFSAIANLASGRDARDVLDQIGAYQQRQLAKAFSQDRDPETGAPWPPLAESTKRQKRNPKALVETIGRIPASLFYEVRRNGLAVGYGDPLAWIHHWGAVTKPRVIRPRRAKALFWTGIRHPVAKVNHPGSVIPARKLIGASVRDREEWVAIAQSKVVDIWGRS